MDYSFEDSLRSITALENLLLWLLVDNSENEGLQHSFLLAYRPMLSIEDVVECIARFHSHSCQKLADINPHSPLLSLLTNQYISYHPLGFRLQECLQIVFSCKKFMFLWVAGYYSVDWKKKIILPRMLEVSRMAMSEEDFGLLKNMCVKDIGQRRKQHVHSIPNTHSKDKSPKHFMNILSPPRPKSTTDATKEWNLLSTHTLATQLTVMEQELFVDVQPNEFLKESWQSTHREALSPRLSTLVKRFNEVSYWVATQVVTSPSVKLQTMMIRKFIKIAYKLFEFHNYNSLMQIISGLHNVSVSRLKPAWAALPGNAQDKFKKITDFMSANQNFQQYREAMNDLAVHKTPALPYLVLFMRDITFIEENSDRTSEGHMNYLKLFRMGRQLHWFIQFTKTDYKFQMDFQIQKVLMALKFMTDSELYVLSLSSEPKHPGTFGPSHTAPAHLNPKVSDISAEDFSSSSSATRTRRRRSSWRQSACWGVKAAAS